MKAGQQRDLLSREARQYEGFSKAKSMTFLPLWKMLFNGMFFALLKPSYCRATLDRKSLCCPAFFFIIYIHISNARDERTAERRQRQSEGTDALCARDLLRKPRDQHRRSAQSHSYIYLYSNMCFIIGSSSTSGEVISCNKLLSKNLKMAFGYLLYFQCSIKMPLT